MNIKDIFLNSDEYFPVDHNKSIIYLHHTSGSHRPDWVVNGWDKDKNSDGSVRQIATSFVIGGKSTRDNDTSWDGVVVRCFPESQWAWHLGSKEASTRVTEVSIGIEVCNYGYLTKSNNGTFMTYVNTPVPNDQVVELPVPFRNYKYYHKYTDKQIESLKQLIYYLSDKFNINVDLGLKEWLNKESLSIPKNLSILEQQKWLNKNGFVGKNGKKLDEDGSWGTNTAWALQSVGKSAFELNPLTYSGYPGIWTHTNIRTDKTDMSPQPNLISMLKSL